MISKNQENFVWGALLGGAIGAAAALLFTPASGAQIRKKFQNGFNLLNGKKMRKAPISHAQKAPIKKAKKALHALHARKRPHNGA